MKILKIIIQPILPVLFCILLALSCSSGRYLDEYKKNLHVHFEGDSAQIEVGGPYVGIEMHRSAPAINRISFFYPVANSIDLSTDYWKRENFRAMTLGLRIGNRPTRNIGLESFSFILTPYSVFFTKVDTVFSMTVNYRFCKDKPAFVAIFEIVNISDESMHCELFTYLDLSLRTSHSYKLKDKAWTAYDPENSVIFANFEDEETGIIQIFVANAGFQPSSFSSRGSPAAAPGCFGDEWIQYSSDLPGEIIDRRSLDRPAAAFLYKQYLEPNQKIRIVQIIGAADLEEGRREVDYLLKNFNDETHRYERTILDKAYRKSQLITGDSILDHSVHWSKAILAANAHYIDGEIVPMPSPAQYNFYFTHDVLLTDLAAVYFDMDRIKRDLDFIIQHADENHTIPHAYYWKDNRYITEYAGTDNWNHFWFILVSARYLRHSGDIPMLETLYPFLLKSMKLTLKNKDEGDLMWAYRPDWWDIGRSFGPRAYMTILTIRALREFNFIASIIGKDIFEMREYEKLTSRMQTRLNTELWDSELNYLVNFYEDGQKDTHYYIGSLLAAHFSLIDDDKKKAIVQTAREKLLDEKLGLYNVYPMDFHLLIDYLKLSGNEAGDPFIYMNGGVWPHGNAWYALALISIGQNSEAYNFIKKTMSIAGIMKSPNGQPAMYEYRNSNPYNPSIYGRVDKPQFLWAGGWYLYALYHLLGVRENVWNISLDPYLIDEQAGSKMDVIINNKLIRVCISGSGQYARSIKFDGNIVPSMVIPEGDCVQKRVDIELGNPLYPAIYSAGSRLRSCRFGNVGMSLVADLVAFPGHKTWIKIVSPKELKSVTINNKEMAEGWYSEEKDGFYLIDISFYHKADHDIIEVTF